MPESSSPPRRQPASERKTARQREFSSKRRRELSDYAFVHKAASLDFGVAKPYGDSERFDFILISRDWPEGDKLLRIQVKCTASLIRGLYHINTLRHCCGGVIPYKPTEVDFVIIHIPPDDSWFIFPIRDTPTCLALRPKSHPGGIHEPNREAWHLLRAPK